MGYRLFFILLFFVFFVEMTGAKPPKKKGNEVVEVNRIMDSVELSHFSDSVSTVLGFCKKELEKINSGNQEFKIVLSSPTFPGGKNLMDKFIAKNLVYPMIAMEDNIQGTAIIRVLITEEGEICNPKIVKSVGSALDFEALRLIKLMPKWTPGNNNGTKVETFFFIPIKFSIQ